MQHHPVRPHSQQDARDPRYAPIPPPPYSTRPSSARPDILHSSDPFLRRRVDVPEQSMHSQPYAYTTAPNYTTPSLGIHGLGEIRRDDHGQVARDRHEHIGQYGSQLPEAPPLPVLPPPPPSSRFHGHPERRERHPDFWKDIPASTTAAAATMFAGKLVQACRLDPFDLGLRTRHTRLTPPAPPPPPYGGPRTMLPPTSPQNHQPQYNGQTTSSRPSIPLPPSFTGARGVSALPTSRLESSMSISSMLGSDVGQPTKDNSSTQKSENGPSINGSFSSPVRTTKTMSSPTRRAFGSALFRRRSPSPGDRKRTEGVVNRPFRAFSNENQRHALPNVRPTSPAAYSLSTPSQSNNQRPLTAEQAPGQQWRFSHHRHSSGSKPGKRPNSQPSGHNTPSQAPPDLRQPRSAVSTTDRYRDLQVAQKYDQLAQEAKRKFNYGPADRPTQQFLEGHIRRMQDERAAKAADARRSPNMSHRPHSVARPSVTTDLPQNLPINRFRSDIENVDHVYNRDPQDVPTATQSPFSPDYLRRSREERLVTNDPQPPTLSLSNSTQSRYSDRREERHRQQFPSTQQSTAANMDRSSIMNRNGARLSLHAESSLISPDREKDRNSGREGLQKMMSRGLKLRMAQRRMSRDLQVDAWSKRNIHIITILTTIIIIITAMMNRVLEPAGLTAAQATTTTKLGVSSVPKPLPRYEGKENCTFTVRVPRFYLSDVEREEITRQRAVWGYDVYTDDSDPLAAAIHAGWIQGSWGDDIDVSMLELSSSSTRAAGKAAVVDVESIEGSLTSPPSQPMVPPKNKDLHLTCLVLPALEQYASKVCNGIKSRAWGNNHDGMSFRIQKVEWVEEGIGKGEARTGEARRKRMRGLMDERRRFGNGFASPVVRVAGALGDGGERACDIVAVGA
ncbi:MAG: hypothetical protein LQ345_000650 [Seirophora villosa]|nr:MAG: hypothetical protein LQ345_000650 [Seirophora villosa]